MSAQPNLRCKNCFRPFAMHDEYLGIVNCYPVSSDSEYEPDDSPEAHVYAAVDELIDALVEFDVAHKDANGFGLDGSWARSTERAMRARGALETWINAARAERSKR